MAEIPDRYLKYRMTIHLLLEALDNRISNAVNAFDSECDYVWTEASTYPDDQAALSTVKSAIAKLEYEDEEQAIGDNATTLAVAGVSPTLMNLLEDVNQAKNALKTGFAEISNFRVQTDEGVVPLSQLVLRSLGRARFKRQEAYRHIFCFEQIPESIGFSQSLIRTVAKKDIEEVLIWLSRQAGGSESSYYHTVSALPFGTKLAMVKGRYNSVRANVKIDGARKMVPATLPLCVPLCSAALPAIKRPKARPDGEMIRTRSDNKLQSQPMFTIGAVSVYRYLEQ